MLLLLTLLLFALPLAAQNTKTDYIYLEAERQMHAQHFDAAYMLLEKCLQTDPSCAAAHHSIAPLEMALRHDSLAQHHLERAAALAPDNYYYKESLAKYHFSQHRPKDATALLEEMSRKWPHKTEVLFMLTDAYAAQGQNDSVFSCLERIEVREGKSEQLSLEKIQILLPRQDITGIYKELESLVLAVPSTTLPQPLLLKILAEPADAYTLLGDIYHHAGNDERAFQYYDSCLTYRPDDILVLNNYAYYLSLIDRDLDRAEQMSRRSNELSPDNPTYMDTLAWVLYKKERYAEAKELMDRLQQLSSPQDIADDSDIHEHIRKINAAVGK